MKREKTWYELGRHIQDQYHMLVSSCMAFDEGDEFEISRIAASICVFCRKVGQRSLIEQAKHAVEFDSRFKMEILDTATEVSADNAADCIGLVAFSVAPKADPKPSQFHPKINFTIEKEKECWVSPEKWWSKEVVRFASDDVRLTRGEIAERMRSEEGVGHVDPFRSADIDRLMCRTSIPLASAIGLSAADAQGQILNATVRAMGHELIRSIPRSMRFEISDRHKYPFIFI